MLGVLLIPFPGASTAQAPASPLSHAQVGRKNVTLSMKNTGLEQLIWEIQRQTGYVFMYGAKDVKAVTGLNVEAEDRPALDVLEACLKDVGLGYTVEGMNVVIKKSSPVPQAQERVTIRGVVKDKSGETLPGAAVKIKGTTTGSATNVDGEFNFTVVPTPGMIIEVSYMGMETREIAYTGQTSLTVVLQQITQSIDEVVVTGYQKIDRRLFTGSADIVKADDLAVGGSNDVSRMLQGKASGVQVQNVSGTFGAAPKMRVRGASSIYGDQKPLWVVDNIVLEDVVDVSADDLSSGDAKTLISSAVAGLNPDDIESFQILKDASATAFYGARAMNGVVVITTKRGKAGIVRVGYSGEFTARLKPTYREYNIMNSQQQMMLYRDMEAKGWLNYSDVSRAAAGGVYRKMYDALDHYDPVTGTFELQNTPEAKTRYLQQFEKVNTDWFGLLFNNSVQQSHSVNLSGGSERATFFASASLLFDPGWTIGDKVSRYTANMNASFIINDYLTFNIATTNSLRQQKAPGTIARETDPVNGTVSRDFDLNPFSFALNTSRTMRPYDNNGELEFYVLNYAPFNIIHELKKNYLDIDMLDSQFQAEFELHPMRGWDIKAMGSIRFVKSTREHKIQEGSNLAECYRADYDATIRGANSYLYADPEIPGSVPVSVLPQGGFYNRTDNRLMNTYFRAMTNYTASASDLHMYNLTAGMEVRKADRRESYSNGFGIQYDRGNVPFIDYRILKKILEQGDAYYGMGNSYERFVAFFVSGGYNYAGKYTFNLTGRYDGSNRMGQTPSSRWLPTWNVSGAWHLHEESFVRPIESITTLTLRSTYGLTASMGPTTNAKAVFLNDIVFRPTQAERENQIIIDQLENANLTWEKQYEFNVGLDVGLLNNDISISSDLYFRRGFDLIGRLKTSAIGGEAIKLANYANMASNGVEFTLNTRNITTPRFKWATNVTFSYNHNEITKLNSSINVMGMISPYGAATEGYPVRGIFAIPFMGLNSDGLPTFLDQDGKVSVSDIFFQESQNLDFLKYMGPVDPKYVGGLDNNFTYGPFRANIFFTYQFGNVVWLHSPFSARYYDNTALPKELADRWMVPGDEKRTNIPVLVSQRQTTYDAYLTQAYNAYNHSTVRVAKGDFIRLKEISMSYDLPKTWLDYIGVENASMRFSASNLCLLYSDKKLKGQDPEFVRSGGVSLPVPRQFSLALKVGF
ncbi:MAG: SusC/RagA family TonB-linked outer membrane protein [Odoribacteraceae bacterium]|nr:SusC/RagA family TonB-linked outer membrane protein [Odoribacteraceae bacterium]